MTGAQEAWRKAVDDQHYLGTEGTPTKRRMLKEEAGTFILRSSMICIIYGLECLVLRQF
jgi:hypothetical protein